MSESVAVHFQVSRNRFAKHDFVRATTTLSEDEYLISEHLRQYTEVSNT